MFTCITQCKLRQRLLNVGLVRADIKTNTKVRPGAKCRLQLMFVSHLWKVTSAQGNLLPVRMRLGYDAHVFDTQKIELSASQFSSNSWLMRAHSVMQ